MHRDERLIGVEGLALAVFDQVCELYFLGSNGGARFTVFDATQGIFLSNPLMIGELSGEGHVKHNTLAQGNALRLRLYKIHQDHMSSRQSRCEGLDMLGGAICLSGQPIIMSLSGLTEMANEAFCVLFAIAQEGFELSIEDAMAIARYGDPQVNQVLFDHLDSLHAALMEPLRHK